MAHVRDGPGGGQGMVEVGQEDPRMYASDMRNGRVQSVLSVRNKKAEAAAAAAVVVVVGEQRRSDKHGQDPSDFLFSLQRKRKGTIDPSNNYDFPPNSGMLPHRYPHMQTFLLLSFYLYPTPSACPGSTIQ